MFSIISYFKALLINRTVVAQFCRREITRQYRGSFMGFAWAFLVPLMMLCVYSFVFIGILKSRWPGAEQAGGLYYSLQLFCGLTVFNLFAEVLGRAPGLIAEQPNLVKKVVFPLEILPFVSLGAALFHMAIGMVILLICVFIFQGLSIYIFLLPIVLIPFLFFLLGLSWFISALCVYLRDISIIIGIVINLVMFLSPVFYSTKILEGNAALLMTYNPLTLPIENLRRILFSYDVIDWSAWLVSLLTGMLIAALGAFFFSLTRDGFGDVL